MLTIFKPNAARITRLIDEQSKLPLTYTEVGFTKEQLPSGYFHNHHSLHLGYGQPLFLQGRDYLRQWKLFDIEWVEVHADGLPAPEQNLVIVANVLGFWTVNCCRVVYVDDTPANDFFAVGLGTLPLHSASGEERLELTFDQQTEEVRFRIQSFSRPRSLSARLGRPYMEHKQRQFARETARGLRKAICNSTKSDDSMELELV